MTNRCSRSPVGSSRTNPAITARSAHSRRGFGCLCAAQPPRGEAPATRHPWTPTTARATPTESPAGGRSSRTRSVPAADHALSVTCLFPQVWHVNRFRNPTGRRGPRRTRDTPAAVARSAGDLAPASGHRFRIVGLLRHRRHPRRARQHRRSRILDARRRRTSCRRAALPAADRPRRGHRGRIRRDELDGDPCVDAVLARLAASRLITLDATTVELTHEALIDAWPRLREWLAENRDGLRVHRQLTDAARRGRRRTGTRRTGARDAAGRCPGMGLPGHPGRNAAARRSLIGQLGRQRPRSREPATRTDRPSRKPGTEPDPEPGRAARRRFLRWLERPLLPEPGDVWDIASGNRQTAFNVDQLKDVAIAYNSARGLVAVAGSDGETGLWDPAHYQQIVELGGHTGAVRALSFSPVGASSPPAADYVSSLMKPSGNSAPRKSIRRRTTTPPTPPPTKRVDRSLRVASSPEARTRGVRGLVWAFPGNRWAAVPMQVGLVTFA